MISLRLRTAIVAIAACGLSAMAFGQYPNKPVRLVVPFPPAGSADIVARRIAPKILELLGQQLVIENRGGAGGVVGSSVVASSAPDGYTLLFASSSHTSNPSIYKKLPFDTEKAFVSIAMVADLPGLVVVHSSLPVNTFREFIEFAKKSSPPITYSTSGSGSFSHLSMELLKLRAGFPATHIPYKGAGPALIDIVGGVVQLKIDGYVSSIGHIKAGKLKPLAVTSLERIPQLPEVPTVAEQGFPGFQTSFWMAIVGPAGMPAAVVAKLEQAFVAATKDKEVVEKFANDGVRAISAPARDVDKLIARELAQWPPIVKNAGIVSE
jgi:tripartite-type tricarboxylate transporter receptor subunit TctC